MHSTWRLFSPRRAGQTLHLVVESTGLEGIRRRRMEGAQARLFQAPHVAQTHLAMDAKNSQICAALMTHQDAGDANVFA